MGLRAIVAWQWQDYGRFHQSRRNLLLHLAFVPLFLAGNVLAVAGLAMMSWRLATVGIVLSTMAFAAQGLGHASEPVPPIPFRGPGNAIARIALEQWVTFPRFVLTGGWERNLRAARSRRRAGSPAASS